MRNSKSASRSSTRVSAPGRWSSGPSSFGETSANRSSIFAAPSSIEYSVCTWRCTNESLADAVGTGRLLDEQWCGGLVVLPGPTGSSYARQDFRSRAFVGRVRREAHGSYASLFGTAREIEGGGHNRVFGPDFRWQRGQHDHLTGQFLLSRSLTPWRPELAGEWDGRRLAGHALFLEWRHARARFDWNAVVTDVGRGFRADLGFVPQVGYRYFGGGLGRTFYREGAMVHELRLFAVESLAESGH